MAVQESKKGMQWWVWLIVLIPVAVVGLGVMSALAIYGVRKYVQNAKQQEAQAALIQWADGLGRCAEKTGSLPPSSRPVPTALAEVSAKQFQSAPGDWNELAHTCAAFSVTTPQYFQYQWELRAPNTGVVHAVADLDGDAAPDMRLDVELTCASAKCQRNEPLRIDDPTRNTGSSNSDSSSPTSTEAGETDGPTPGPIAIAFFGLCLLSMLTGAIWGIVAAFQVSVGWGLLVLFMPCAGLVFLIKHWEESKRPFFLRLASLGVFMLGAMAWGVVIGRTGGKSEERDEGTALLESPSAIAPVLSAVPPPVGIPALDGAPVDLSTVMGRARRLANEWQKDAALLGIEATQVVDTQIQTQAGGAAVLTFGPSSFNISQPRQGLFVVTYDKNGITGAPAKGKAGPELPEPMCAPEFIYQRVAREGQNASVTLRYALDDSQKPLWFAAPSDTPNTKAQGFDPQTCQVAITRRR